VPGTLKKYPIWLTGHEALGNLREVGPGLFVGDQYSPKLGRWAGVLDLCGGLSATGRHRYASAQEVISLPFMDGDAIPELTLDIAWELYRKARGQPVLIQCAAGLSRSTSVAYALLRRHHGFSHERALRRVQVPGREGEYPMPRTLASARAWVHQHPPRDRR